MAADSHQPTTKTTKGSVVGSAASSTSKKRKERVPLKPEVAEINQFLICQLCQGYLIDATAIVECQHTFCKSCILTFLNSKAKPIVCPICDVVLQNADEPHSSLRSDVILQRLVYKLIPGILLEELRRRIQRAKENAKLKKNKFQPEDVYREMALEVGAPFPILSEDEVVSLSIEYFRGNEYDSNKPGQKESGPKKLEASQSPPSNFNVQDVSSSNDNTEANDRRYLKCPAGVSVGLLKKFIRMKYGLSDNYRVDLLYNGDRDIVLENDLTLLDLAFIFKWNKDEPMKMHYRIFDRVLKTLTNRAGTKRAASSMHEPPDDDTASGPHNRRPMASAATAPSSKIARVSSNTTSGAGSKSGSSGGSARTTSTLSFSAPIYDFSEGNSDSEEPTMQKGKFKLRTFRKDSTSSTNSSNVSSTSSSKESEKGSQGMKKQASSTARTLSYSSKPHTHGTKHKEIRTCRRNFLQDSSTSGNAKGLSTRRNENRLSLSQDSDSSTESEEAKTTALTNSRVRSAAQTVMQSQVNGVKLNLSSGAIGERRESLKLSFAKSPEHTSPHKHKHKHHHKMKHKKKHKPLKISLSLSPQGNASTTSAASTMTHASGGNKETGIKTACGKPVKVAEKAASKVLLSALGQGGGKPGIVEAKKVAMNAGNNGSSGNANSSSNFPAGVKSTTSAQLCSISKNISVSIGVGSSSSNTSSTTTVKTTQFANKKPTALLSKNSGIEIQPSTGRSQTVNQNPQQQSNSANLSSSQGTSSRTHPLLPESVHVPKSVTLIPVNPNVVGSSGSVSSGRGGSSGISNATEKSGSGGVTGTLNRLNAHTFTHPITNKSLHQITVTEVPPPTKSGNAGGGNNTGASTGNGGSVNNVTSGGMLVSHSQSVEKAMAGSGTSSGGAGGGGGIVSKPQFNGPGSMEITKIYCNTNTKENPAKKLKERKGLDISIVPGMNQMKEKKVPKLEETMKQKIAFNNAGTTMTLNTGKIKPSNNPSPNTLFNTKMPPGITIGPAGMHKSNQGGGSNNSGNNNSAGNTITALGFTLPPHITAHAQHHPHPPKLHTPPQQQQQQQQQSKTIGGDKMNKNVMLQNKGFHSQMTLGSKVKEVSFPPKQPAVVTGNKSSIDSRKQQQQQQLEQALSSMVQMSHHRNNIMKSPSPPKSSNLMTMSGSSKVNMKPGTTTGQCEKRVLDMSSSSNRKNSRDSPEPKRSRSTDAANAAASLNSTKASSSTHETPLDLSAPCRISSSRPNSNSSSPVHHHHHSARVGNSSSPLSILSPNNFASSDKGKHGHSSSEQGFKKSPSPLPPNKASPISPGFPSPNSNSSSSSVKSPSSSSSGQKVPTPTGSAHSISSIVHNLTQKQLGLSQQQHKELLHNQLIQLQQMQQQQHHQHQHQQTLGKVGTHSLSPKGGNPSLALSPPVTLSNPSPPSGPGFDSLRTLLSDARLGKVHSMNSLMAAAAVSLCPPTGHPGLSLPPHTTVPTNHLFSHLTTGIGGKSPTGLLDQTAQAYLQAAISAHNERLAVAAGMSHFGDSLNTPLSVPGSFYPQVPIRTTPPSGNNNPHGSLRIPAVVPPCKTGSASSVISSNNKKGSPTTPPLSFQPHPPTAPRSPTKATSNSISPVTSSSSSLHSNNKTGESVNNKNMNKINGAVFPNQLPILPPGIHNPLLPNYSSRPQTTSNSNLNPGSHIGSSTKSIPSDNKKGIPNSMKISNFLPNKPKDGKSVDNSNVEATITSGSHLGGSSLTKFLNSIPPLLPSQAASSNLSPTTSSSSSSTLSKDPPGMFALNSKSTSEQESKTFGATFDMQQAKGLPHVHNPIKKEVKSNIADGANNSKLSSFSPRTSIEDRGKVKHGEDGGPIIMGYKEAPFMLGLTSARTSHAQPQNQSVRHIPNPALLFNRQHSSGSASSTTVTSPSTTTTESSFAKTHSFVQKPLKLDELHIPSLPFPGVSVPVQVKVDNDAVPIPIQMPREATKTSLETLSVASKNIKIEATDNSFPSVVTTSPPKKENDAEENSKESVQEQSHETNEEENPICEKEEIVKIDNSADDMELELDIDVGIETTPTPLMSPTKVTSDTQSTTNTNIPLEQSAVVVKLEPLTQAQETNPTQNEKQTDVSHHHHPEEKAEEGEGLNQPEALPLENEKVDITASPEPSSIPFDGGEEPAPSLPEVESTKMDSETVSQEEEATAPQAQTMKDERIEEALVEKVDTKHELNIEEELELVVGSEEEEEVVVSEAGETTVQLSSPQTLLVGESESTIPLVEVETLSTTQEEDCTTVEQVQNEIPEESQIPSPVTPIENQKVYDEGNVTKDFDETAQMEVETVEVGKDETECGNASEITAFDDDDMEKPGSPTTTTLMQEEESSVPESFTLPASNLNVEEELSVPSSNPLEFFALEIDESNGSILLVPMQPDEVEEGEIVDEEEILIDNSNKTEVEKDETLIESSSDSQLESNNLPSASADVISNVVPTTDEGANNNNITEELSNPVTIDEDKVQADRDNPVQSIDDDGLSINADIDIEMEEEVGSGNNSLFESSESVSMECINAAKTLIPSPHSPPPFEICSDERVLLPIEEEEEDNVNMPLATDTNVLDVVEQKCQSSGNSISAMEEEQGADQETSSASLTLSEESTLPTTSTLTTTPTPATEDGNSGGGDCDNVKLPDMTIFTSSTEVDNSMMMTLTLPSSSPITIGEGQEDNADMDVDMEEVEPETHSKGDAILTTTANPPSPPTLLLDDDNNFQIMNETSPSFISATATITTTTAEISSDTAVLDVGPLDSPLSSRASLEESPASPEDNKTKIETLEKVAAGLLASAANSINNNNSKSLAISTPTCDIVITATTTASDVATM